MARRVNRFIGVELIGRREHFSREISPVPGWETITVTPMSGREQ